MKLITNTSELKSLRVEHLGQIREGQVDFGDLTILVGPQASGKSIFLQMLKFVIDREHIADSLSTYGYNWQRDVSKLFELVLGEGMGGIWNPATKVIVDGQNFPQSDFMPSKGRKTVKEQLFYVIAQRVVTMQLGWPRAFQSFEVGDPYVIKSFSESLRQLMEKESNPVNGGKDEVFPKAGRIKESFRNLIDSGLFFGSTIEMDSASLKKRFMLRVGETRLPFMVWSAGQKEFMPLLLSIYHLMPRKAPRSSELKWVVIEEPEMGLHPKAIQGLMAVFLELIHRGYKVVVSTHSPVLLELAWAIRFIQAHGGSSSDLHSLFALPRNVLNPTFKDIIEQKEFKTYYFDRKESGVVIQDISTLDPGSEDVAVADWGGLTEFASRAGEVVSKLASNG